MSCGRPVGGMFEKFRQRVASGEPAGKVLDDLGMKSYCCRALFMTHIDTLEKIAKFRI
ncbi:MAG: DNA-directed RNA polymerase subunit N [Candidatus Aenigmarchaeota archaeon]|nr:DNA-directed RNA polymerase subunit N [Candidatus Aenigmarchaeota archaeon]